jgi:SAM-dependent methyltransferase
MCLNGGHRGKLLDVGCGNGSFLAMMQDAGWEVTGVDPDKVAATLARKRFGISILNGSLEDAGFAEESFDAVTLSHVIEHVYDPVALLRECRRVLRPGGKIVVTTPNLASQGHRAFGSSWVPLDPPRHLHLFTSATLGACCERAGLSIQSVATSARGAGWVWAASKIVFKKGSFCRETDITVRLKIEGLAFQLREERSQRTDVESGEELLLIATT